MLRCSGIHLTSHYPAIMKHFLFRNNLAIVIIATTPIIAGIYFWVVIGEDLGWKIMLASSSGGISFFYFFQKQKLDEIRLMKELITDFNSRYDNLNGELNDILRKGDEEPSMELDQNDRAILNDYFNLCAEEYLFKKLGYIHPRVWEAWYRGMEIYFKDRRICELWEQEEKDSYYGFTSPEKKKRSFLTSVVNQWRSSFKS